MRRLLQVATVTGALALAGCGLDADQAAEEPGIGELAELDVAEADRIEVREGGNAWPTPGRGEAREDAEVVAVLTDPTQVDALVEALEDARYIDTGAVIYDLAPPDYQVGFLQDDELVERLGYYERVTDWGEHEVPGRWLTEDWDLLAVTEELPALD